MGPPLEGGGTDVVPVHNPITTRGQHSQLRNASLEWVVFLCFPRAILGPGRYSGIGIWPRRVPLPPGGIVLGIARFSSAKLSVNTLRHSSCPFLATVTGGGIGTQGKGTPGTGRIAAESDEGQGKRFPKEDQVALTAAFPHE